MIGRIFRLLEVLGMLTDEVKRAERENARKLALAHAKEQEAAEDDRRARRNRALAESLRNAVEESKRSKLPP